MGAGTERPKPERRRVVVLLLRRIAILAVVLSLALWLGPKALVELGVLGPSAPESIASAERTLKAAESYGATAKTPSFTDAQRALQESRDRLARGEAREAKRAARRASDLAIESQRSALVEVEQRRRRAEAVVKDLDARVNALEDRFDEVTPGLGKPEISTLITAMKEARAAAGLVFLAWEKGQPERVLAGEAGARAAVDAAARGLEQAARHH
jgi:hypothetical protein